MWHEIVGILRHPVQNHLGMLILATIPAAVVGYLWSDYFEGVFKSGSLLGLCFLATAAILTTSEIVAQKRHTQKPLSAKSALSMGLMQALAIFPGISRSGSTIAGGLFFGVDRTRVAKFSFLMSIPIILGSLFSSGKTVMEAGMGDVSIAAVVAGTIAAGVAGFFAVRFMLALIKKTKLYGFAIYVAALGVFLLLDQFVFHIVF